MTLLKSTLRAGAFGLAFCAATAGNAQSKVEQAGDVLQVALPLAAAVCAYRKQDFKRYTVRFVGQGLFVEGSKAALGHAKINKRPDGAYGRTTPTYKGFPSGHTAAAFYGASYLAHNCLQTKGQKALAYGLAAFVGGSRIQANKHTAAQVVAGALVGYYFDNLTVQFDRGTVNFGLRYKF